MNLHHKHFCATYMKPTCKLLSMVATPVCNPHAIKVRLTQFIDAKISISLATSLPPSSESPDSMKPKDIEKMSVGDVCRVTIIIIYGKSNITTRSRIEGKKMDTKNRINKLSEKTYGFISIRTFRVEMICPYENRSVSIRAQLINSILFSVFFSTIRDCAVTFDFSSLNQSVSNI